MYIDIHFKFSSILHLLNYQLLSVFLPNGAISSDNFTWMVFPPWLPTCMVIRLTVVHHVASCVLLFVDNWKWPHKKQPVLHRGSVWCFSQVLENARQTRLWSPTPVRMAAIQNLQTINAREGVEKRERSHTVGGNWWECKLIQPLWFLYFFYFLFFWDSFIFLFFIFLRFL